MSRRAQFFAMLAAAILLFSTGLVLSATKYAFVNFFLFAGVAVPAISIRLYDIWMNPDAYVEDGAIQDHLMPALHVIVWSSVVFGGLGFGAFQRFPILMGILAVLITLNTLSTTVWNIGKPWAKKMLAHASTVGIVITIPILILTVYSNVLFGHSVLPSGDEKSFEDISKIKADFKEERIKQKKADIAAEKDLVKKARLIEELDKIVAEDSIWGMIFGSKDDSPHYEAYVSPTEKKDTEDLSEPEVQATPEPEPLPVAIEKSKDEENFDLSGNRRFNWGNGPSDFSIRKEGDLFYGTGVYPDGGAMLMTIARTGPRSFKGSWKIVGRPQQALSGTFDIDDSEAGTGEWTHYSGNRTKLSIRKI